MADYRERYYVDGNTVRRLETLPEYRPERKIEKAPRPKRRPDPKMDLLSVVVIAACVITSLWICFGFLQTQMELNSINKTVLSLEKNVIEIQAENTATYEKINDSVDLNQIYKEATNRLGMVRAESGQVYTYSNEISNTVRQYGEIPTY